jgi:hypothetical protein
VIVTLYAVPTTPEVRELVKIENGAPDVPLPHAARNRRRHVKAAALDTANVFLSMGRRLGDTGDIPV